MNVYLIVVSDVIAYRYLVKHYYNLFKKLDITFEEYMDYKVERMYNTLRDKKEKVDDILSYIYMSFMLSSPRLIYDYAEQIGKCKLVKELLPYFKVQRQKFFLEYKDNTREHYIYNVDNIDLDKDSEAIRSNIEKYSLSEYNKKDSALNTDSYSLEVIKSYISDYFYDNDNITNILFNIFDNWENKTESDYMYIKQTYFTNKDFSFIDYIRYLYENNKLNITYTDYTNILKMFNDLFKIKGELSL